MHCLVGFGYIASLGILLVAGCGGAGSNSGTECVDNVCPCSEGGIRAAIREAGIRTAITEGLGPYTFDCDGPTTVIAGSEIVIDADVTLDGSGILTVDGTGAHRVFSVPDGVTAELIGVTVANGNETDEHGGGIRNEGTLTLTNTTVSGSSAGRESGCRTDNPALLCSEGGGIWNAGTLTLIDSTVSGNTAPFGGGIANRQGSLTVIDSDVLSNVAEGCQGAAALFCSGGGGIWNSGAMTMINSTVSGSAANWGAGIYNRGVPTLTNSTISGNASDFDGGGLLNFETLTLIDSTVADNVADQSGGGIANEAGTLQVTNSTLSGNSAAAGGGGLFNPLGAAATLLNTTVSTNAAGREGGGIYSGGDLSLTSSTVARNDATLAASAIYDPGSPGPRVRSIANTVIEGDCADSPPFDSGGYNIERPGDTCGFSHETDNPEGLLDLGALAENGGRTKTHALGAVSVAVDAIPTDDCVASDGTPLMTDQRGFSRPVGGACDLGAFEVQPEVQP